jgi:SAM-dependent methyltransferase
VTDRFGPEISDLIVDYDPDTLERRPITKRAVIERLESEGRAAPVRVASALGATADGLLDAAEVDGVLLRSHLELQRLHEEFRVAALVRTLVAPLVELARAAAGSPVRLVDIGAGLGFVARWLSAHGALGDDVEVVGADYNRTLVGAANALAEAENLRCRFVAANAFRLSPRAHVYTSTGVLHHFRGPDLERLFAEHDRAGALGFVHLDIRPSLLAPIGSWIFHQARMREPLAKWDGYWSAVRAHSARTLLSAAEKGAPGFTTASVDAYPGLHAIVRIFQAIVGVRMEYRGELERAYGSLGARVRFEARG